MLQAMFNNALQNILVVADKIVSFPGPDCCLSLMELSNQRPSIFQTAAAPVENGNGLSCDLSSSEDSQPANESSPQPQPANHSSEESSKRSLDTESEAPSSKRVCTEAPAAETGEAQELSKEVAKEFTNEVPVAESEAPNGVNNTPHQITSGGD